MIVKGMGRGAVECIRIDYYVFFDFQHLDEPIYTLTSTSPIERQSRE